MNYTSSQGYAHPQSHNYPSSSLQYHSQQGHAYSTHDPSGELASSLLQCFLLICLPYSFQIWILRQSGELVVWISLSPESKLSCARTAAHDGPFECPHSVARFFLGLPSFTQSLPSTISIQSSIISNPFPNFNRSLSMSSLRQVIYSQFRSETAYGDPRPRERWEQPLPILS